MTFTADRERVVSLDPFTVEDDVVEVLNAAIAQQSDLNADEIEVIHTLVIDADGDLDSHAKVTISQPAD
jgi:hypothetical protein